MPPKVIALANTEVEKVKNKGPQGTRSAPYLILTPAQRFQAGKRAAEHMASCHKFVLWHRRSLWLMEYFF